MAEAAAVLLQPQGWCELRLDYCSWEARKTAEADGTVGAHQTQGAYNMGAVHFLAWQKLASNGKHYKGRCRISVGIQTPRLG